MQTTASSRNKTRERKVEMIDRKAFKTNQLYLSNWAKTGKLQTRSSKVVETNTRQLPKRQVHRASDKENTITESRKGFERLTANVQGRRDIKATRKAAKKVTKLVSSENSSDRKRLTRQASDKGKTLKESTIGHKRSSEAVK